MDTDRRRPAPSRPGRAPAQPSRSGAGWTPYRPGTTGSADQPARFAYRATTDQVDWSAELTAMLGYPAPNGPAGRRLLLRAVHRDDHAKALRAFAAAWAGAEPVRTTLRLVRADGGWVDVDCRMEAMTEPSGRADGVRGTVVDVTVRERARREADRRTRRLDSVQATVSERDAGTGLLTRDRFADELDREVRRTPSAGAVLVLRIEPDGRHPDLLPERNAELLHRAARVIEDVVHPGDQIGLVGPNEIAVLLTGASWALAHRQAEQLVEALRAHPFVLPDSWLRARAWAGLVRYQAGAQSTGHDLLIDAEHAWRQGRAADLAVTPVVQPVPVRERQGSYRSRITAGLGAAQFTLFAQPIMELQTSTTTRHELLLRVVDEVHGPYSPVAFLDNAERLDAVFDVDLWVTERAVQLATARSALHLQVNLSGRSISDPRLTDRIERLFRNYAVDPARFTFEITETALIANVSEARRCTDRLRALGCQLALDDFGSGYASFRYLKLLPFDVVKIDGEYVADLPDNPQDQVVVRALVQVCQAYGIRTVAEFVQDERTLRLLRGMGVDFAQGYLIGRPEPVEDLLTGDAPPWNAPESGPPAETWDG